MLCSCSCGLMRRMHAMTISHSTATAMIAASSSSTYCHSILQPRRQLEFLLLLHPISDVIAWLISFFFFLSICCPGVKRLFVNDEILYRFRTRDESSDQGRDEFRFCRWASFSRQPVVKRSAFKIIHNRAHTVLNERGRVEILRTYRTYGCSV